MPATSATYLGNTATCLKVQRQDQRAIAGVDNAGANTCTDYIVIIWDNQVHPLHCRGATDGTNVVPVRGTAHPLQSTLQCKQVRIQTIQGTPDTKQHYEAQCDYSDQLDLTQNPLTLPTAYEWTFTDGSEEPYFMDNDPNGPKPVLNSAHDRFADFLKRDGSPQITVTCTKNIAVGAFNPSTYVALAFPTPAVNSDAVTIDGASLGAGQVKFAGVTCGDVQQQNGYKFRTLKTTVTLRDNWNDVVDDRGFNELVVVGPDKCLQPIIRGTPTDTKSPWPMDGNGTGKPNVDDTPAQLTFYPYPQQTFGSITA